MDSNCKNVVKGKTTAVIYREQEDFTTCAWAAVGTASQARYRVHTLANMTTASGAVHLALLATRQYVAGQYTP